MSIELSQDFRVRFSECDGFGHLKSAAYLTYVQETTLQGLTSLGLDAQTFTAQKLALQAGQVFIDYRRPFTYQDCVEVTAQLSSLSPTHMTWDYCLTQAGSNEAHAQIKIKFKPYAPDHKIWTDLPPELLRSLQPPDNHKPATSHMDSPDMPDPPPGAITRQRPVAWREANPNLTLNLAAYLENLLEVTNQAGAACGWTFERVTKAGFASVIRRQWFRVFEPAVYGDELMISTWLSPFKSVSVTRHVTFRRAADEALLATANTLWVVIDMATGRPIRIPAAWRTDFAPQVSLE